MEDRLTEPRTTMMQAVGWAVYIGCSWTWVIGMYLPVLLVRDYGLSGWVVFAIPNVLGAAAMGWVLRTRQQALAIAAAHAPAVALFSIVTISFQVFALLWLLPRLVGAPGLGLVFAALACALVPALAPATGGRRAAAVVWAISAIVFVLLWIGEDFLRLPPRRGLEPAWHLVGLAPACLLGFLLCPYLDATFLRARAATDARAARIAFTLGFGGFFCAMIVFSLLYAVPLVVGDYDRDAAAAWLLAVHLSAQVAFTAAAHARVARDGEGLVGPIASPTLLVVGVLVAALLGMIALAGELAIEREPSSLAPGEIIYRAYLGFYGLLFPAYVLLVMFGGASRRAWVVTCLVALPFFVAGFLLGQMPWTAGGVMVVVLAALVLAIGRRGGPETAGGRGG